MILNMDVYFREMMQLEIGRMKRIKHHHRKVVTVDTETSGYDTEEENAKNAGDDCEHVECHKIMCKKQNLNLSLQSAGKSFG